ncbi:helix-hairpin-helix domain-containing protein [Tissierella sp.]|uniref:helix-hairpin-helix domain-containing protein n=1 Tax=Tissierella sp. TaxID=41274 RepID=UPI0028663F36|nr:helix-hairpin-helix domain-containing protein [Tissierella sp.]MDR7857084.1 helix-hairpin-helix domain-containing protein [Tissierella sp.]
MGSFTKREQIGILVIVLIIIFTLGFKFVIKDIIKPRNENIDIIKDLEIISSESDEKPDIIYEEDKIIMVHISGQVYNPGIIELELGKRVTDAVELAGGLKKEADLDRINLAKKLVDEEKIYIPKIGEEISVDLSITTISNDTTSTGKVNINTCSKAELVNLPGIGDVIADRIIEYRLTNKFSTIEDIKNVSGLGDKKFEGIKELIIVK